MDILIPVEKQVISDDDKKDIIHPGLINCAETSDRSRSVKKSFLFEDQWDELNDFSAGAGNTSTIYSAGHFFGFHFSMIEKMEHTIRETFSSMK